MLQEAKTFMIEGAEIIFKNFEGREGPFNLRGQRSFVAILPNDIAEQMLADGWNVKYLKPQEEGDIPKAIINVAVRFDVYPPRIVMMTAKTRTNLDESTVEVLDWANIGNIDFIARGNQYSVNGKDGLKAYLKSMFVTIEEDALERKYSVNEVE